ncbi:glycosyltransferase family 9 protein [Runella zeae]|uniref:glycosyltransferase family 9 protein n=1 Tax=Runella zeae TaxID=94255 RepID=UPI000422A70B|nr:glycosyltransferase family 9 protein [Runella zeae]
MKFLKRKYSGTPRETLPMRVIDFFVDLYSMVFYKRRKLTDVSVDAPKILIASLGHLGDALTTTYIFPIIKAKYPKAQIDLLAPKWCQAINQINPYINQLITLNHFQTNRQNISFWAKVVDHYRSFKEALPLLRASEYDYYIDLRYSNAVAHFILPFIKVKKAYGFSRRGLGGLLDKEFELPTAEFHHFDMYLMLLKEIGVEGDLASVKPYLYLPADLTLHNVLQKIPSIGSDYCLVFPESGHPQRQLSSAYWAQMLTKILEEKPLSIVFCGQTSFSAQIISQINTAYASYLIDSSSQINIYEIAVLAKSASFAITLDSFPEHLCCVFCPTFTFYKSAGYPFFPIANFPVYLKHNHIRSAGLKFDRSNVLVEYVEPLETLEVQSKVVGQIQTILKSSVSEA